MVTNERDGVVRQSGSSGFRHVDSRITPDTKSWRRRVAR